MAGADIANVCSVLLRKGVGEIETLVRGVNMWLESHEYTSLQEVKGILSHKQTQSRGFERANYVQLIAPMVSRQGRFLTQGNPAMGKSSFYTRTGDKGDTVRLAVANASPRTVS